MKIKVKILKGIEAKNWKSTRKIVFVDYFKRSKLDGIKPLYNCKFSYKSYISFKKLKFVLPL